MNKVIVLLAFLLGVLSLSSSEAASPAVVINELMASNVRSYPDITDFEDYPGSSLFSME